jgi:hypothetical protein
LSVLAAVGLEEPAAEPEALVTGWVLYDSIEGDVLADDDLSHSVLLRCVPLEETPNGTGLNPLLDR